jgi:hypothetical protein
VTVSWKELHDEELHNLFSSENIMSDKIKKKYGMGGACCTHGRDEEFIRNLYRI